MIKSIQTTIFPNSISIVLKPMQKVVDAMKLKRNQASVLIKCGNVIGAAHLRVEALAMEDAVNFFNKTGCLSGCLSGLQTPADYGAFEMSYQIGVDFVKNSLYIN